MDRDLNILIRAALCAGVVKTEELFLFQQPLYEKQEEKKIKEKKRERKYIMKLWPLAGFPVIHLTVQ